MSEDMEEQEREDLTVDALEEAWGEWTGGSHYSGRQRFIASLEALWDNVDIEWCGECDIPRFTDDLTYIDSQDVSFCDSCIDNMSVCDRCEGYTSDCTTTVSGNEWCQDCADNYASYCEHCDESYDSDECLEHEHLCDCEPPTLNVNMRNGSGTISQDERTKIALPGGVIDDEGISRIRDLLRNNGLCGGAFHALADTDRRWQTKEGNYTKRFSRYAYKHDGTKITPEVLTLIGGIAREHSSEGSEWNVEITRDLNLSAEDFGNEDSCWWGSHHESRCALKNNGGFGLRAFADVERQRYVYGAGTYETYTQRNVVQARAWLMPVRMADGKFTPTFDAEHCDALLVFNGYIEGSEGWGYTPARIVAHMTGWTYRKVGLNSAPMYVNGTNGFLVGPEEIVSVTDRVHMNMDAHGSLYYHEEAHGALASV